VLDMETDPFDNISQAEVRPFLAVIYSDDFDPIIIWEEAYGVLCVRIVAALEALPYAYTIYAHNGGRFDFMFLLHHVRGEVSFKGRGIMACRLGKHELRDSFHIIPERLANWQKDSFDYAHLKRGSRARHKAEIIRYCINDCRYLLSIVQAFIADFGLKLSIGQAAMCELRQSYDVKRFSDGHDSYVRRYYFGGRVECLRGRGRFAGDYKLYDVNSMYPFVMATCEHPIGDFWSYKIRTGVPSNDTVFVDVDCVNRGALVARGPDGETTANISRGRFYTTIHEYSAACELNLISDISINYCVDCSERTNFADFVKPRYDKRQQVKRELARLAANGLRGSVAWNDLRKDDIFLKLLLNNAYGKFAQNPRRYKEHYITDPNETPPSEWYKSIPESERVNHALPDFECDRYWLWSKPAPGFRFNNVGTAASITGAARAVLLRAIHVAADPIYCDTDSLICRDLGGVVPGQVDLGSWCLEDELSEVLIAGKKLYACRYRVPKRLADGQFERFKIRSKGSGAPTWDDFLSLINGETITMVAKAPTLDRFGDQYYITRNLNATAPLLVMTDASVINAAAANLI
jgi:DNA polymerase type B, organellar and viral